MKKSINNFVELMSSKIKQKKAIILIGAGVSMIPPSNLPSGKQLKEIVLESLLTKNFKKDINLLRKNKTYNEIIPEVLFSEMHLILKKEIFNAFKILGLSKPNNIHKFLAKLNLKYSTPIFTTNFDLLIDSFLPDNSVHHLHGDLNNIENIYIVLKQILKGIPVKDWENYDKYFGNKELFVLGYSGNDRDILRFIDNSRISNINWLVRQNDTFVQKNLKAITTKKIVLFNGDLNDIVKLLSIKFPLLKSIELQSQTKIQKDTYTAQNKIISEYKNSISHYKTSIVLMRVYHRIGMYKRSIEIGKNLLNDKSININDHYRACVLTSDIIRLSPGGQVEALEIIDNIINDRKSRKSYVYAEVLNGKAVILLNKASFELPSNSQNIIKTLKSALKYLERDKNQLDTDLIFSKERYNIMKAFIFQNIGLGYYYLKEFSKSKRYFLRSLKLKRQLNHLNGIISTYNSLAINEYAKRGRSYLYWKNKTFELIDKYSLFKLKIEFYRELGLIMIEKGEPKKGINALETALSIARKQLLESRHIAEISFILKNEKVKLKYKIADI